ncbi:hypothetical protein CK203_039296 [Vitis vinifera]|uniref:F-box/LRR-repeat protein n=1 Tax=Vitis vinifera TaxID=29760 RepID=A0A438HGL7_VITVI|nr:hypothetical protein CK203_039296 [Vitis vinifera]
MAVTGVAVNCYWNGRVKKESNDVVYEGAKVNVMPIKVFHGTTYAGLLDKIYATTAIDRQNFELNIICNIYFSQTEESWWKTVQGLVHPDHINFVKEITLDVSSSQIGDRRKWEELNINCLVNVFQKVGMETLLLDVPLVCKLRYKATLHPMCWQHLIFPENFKAFADRIMKEYQNEIPITSFIKFIVNRSSGCATTLMLPYAAVKKGWSMLLSSKCPALKVFGLHGCLSLKNASVIPKLIRNWKNLELMLPKSYVGANEASAIVTHLPKIKHLSLKGATIEKKNLVMILRCCRELVRCEGSTHINNYEVRELHIALRRMGRNNFLLVNGTTHLIGTFRHGVNAESSEGHRRGSDEGGFQVLRCSYFLFCFGASGILFFFFSLGYAEAVEASKRVNYGAEGKLGQFASSVGGTELCRLSEAGVNLLRTRLTLRQEWVSFCPNGSDFTSPFEKRSVCHLEEGGNDEGWSSSNLARFNHCLGMPTKGFEEEILYFLRRMKGKIE